MNPPLERRRHARILLKGTAIVLVAEHAVRCRIANLSEGGFLGSTLVTAPARLLGRTADIELRLDDPEAKWMRVEARIARITAEHIALTFSQPRPALIRLVESMITASRVRHRRLVVVLIDTTADARHRMAEAFREVGCEVIEAASALEAVVRLGELAFEPDLIAVGESVPAAAALELRDFVRRDHASVKLVSLTDSEQVIDAAEWLLSTVPDENLVTRIRDVLARRFP